MAVLLLLLLSLSLSLSTAANAAESSVASALHSKSRDGGGIADLTDSDYQQLIIRAARPFHAFILFTAPPAHCALCESVEAEFRSLAASHWAAAPDSTEIFFLTVGYSAAKAAFRMHNLKSVPVIAHFAPSDYPSAPQLTPDAKGIVPISSSMMHSIVDEQSYSAESLSSFVRARSHVSITIRRSPLPRLALLAALLAVAAAAGKLAIDNLPSLLEWVRNPNLWRNVSAGVFVAAISGMVFVIIRDPPMFYCNNKRCMFIHPQSGTQFIAEGFIVGAMIVACAAIAVFLIKIMRGTAGLPTDKVKGFTIAALIGFIVVYGQVIALYRFKASWYPFRLIF